MHKPPIAVSPLGFKVPIQIGADIVFVDVIWESKSVITVRHDLSDMSRAVFGKIMTLLYGGPPQLESFDSAATGAAQASPHDHMEEAASVVPEPKKVTVFIEKSLLKPTKVGPDAATSEVFAVPPSSADEPKAATGASPVLKLSRFEQPIAVSDIVKLLTEPPMDGASLLGRKAQGRFPDSVLTRVWFGYPVALAQKAECAGKSDEEWRAWKSQAANPLIDIDDLPGRGAYELALICMAVSEHYPGVVPQIDIRTPIGFAELNAQFSTELAKIKKK